MERFYFDPSDLAMALQMLAKPELCRSFKAIDRSGKASRLHIGPRSGREGRRGRDRECIAKRVYLQFSGSNLFAGAGCLNRSVYGFCLCRFGPFSHGQRRHGASCCALWSNIRDHVGSLDESECSHHYIKDELPSLLS